MTNFDHVTFFQKNYIFLCVFYRENTCSQTFLPSRTTDLIVIFSLFYHINCSIGILFSIKTLIFHLKRRIFLAKRG